MKQKLTVVTDDHGKVLATQIGHEGTRDPRTGITVGIVAGPGQKLHKIEFDVPQMASHADVDAFHKKLAEHLSAGGAGRKS
jgi:hypothetical protein